MKGKKILVIGSGGYNKRFIWDAAREYGVDVSDKQQINNIQDSSGMRPENMALM